VYTGHRAVVRHCRRDSCSIVDRIRLTMTRF
jgi:hypothetical protein